MFRVSSIPAQSSAACLGQAVTMIMSQRIILGLHDWRSTVAPSANTRPDRYELSSGQKGRSNMHILARSTGGVETAVVSTPGTGSQVYTPTTGAPLKSFVPNIRRSMGDMEGSGPGVVHVHVHEDVKEDYDSVFTPSTGYPHRVVCGSISCCCLCRC